MVLSKGIQLDCIFLLGRESLDGPMDQVLLFTPVG